MIDQPQTPRQHYEADLARHGFLRDPAQDRAVGVLDALYQRLVTAPRANWSRFLGREASAVKGLYLWGGVGRGKTWLMDSFFECLPFDDKLRLHFHRFMHEVHAELKGLPEQADPLKTVAQRFRNRARIRQIGANEAEPVVLRKALTLPLSHPGDDHAPAVSEQPRRDGNAQSTGSPCNDRGFHHRVRPAVTLSSLTCRCETSSRVNRSRPCCSYAAQSCVAVATAPSTCASRLVIAPDRYR